MEVFSEVLKNTVKKIENISIGIQVSGIPSGFDRLDRLTSGWQIGDLISIGSRPGMGKTSFALAMAKNISVDFETPVAYFSIETNSTNLIQKLISAETGFPLNKVRKGEFEKHEWEILNLSVMDLKKAPFFVDDTPSLSIEHLENKIKALIESQGIKVVIIDYLQLMTINDKNSIAANREQYISIIIKKLKYIARFYGVVVIAFSQLSRALETRGGSKRPILSDFRESGAIEDDSDLVGMLYRPEYYKIDEWDDEERTPTEGQAEFIIAKNRNGGLDNVRLKFDAYIGKFDNLEEFEFNHELVSNSFNENPFATPNLPSTDEAFGSSLNDGPDEDNDIPF